MKKHFYDGRFKIKKINFNKILIDFRIYKINLDLIGLKKESNFKEYSLFLKKIRDLKDIKSFFLNEKLYILGGANLVIDSIEFTESFIIGEPYEIYELEELEKIEPLVLLNLIVRYMAYKDINKIDDNIRCIDMNSIYFFVNKLYNNKVYKFLKCNFETSKYFNDYIISLNQKTLTHESLIYDKSKLKRSRKIGYDSATRLLIPSEDGKYYEKSIHKKGVVATSFLVKTPKDLSKLRSFYFTLLKKILENEISKYIKIEIISLENYEYFKNKSNRSYFKRNLKKISRDIDIYLIKDRFKNGEDVVAKDRGVEIFELINNLDFGNYVVKNRGIGEVTTNYNKNNWNIFLLNTTDSNQLLYDGYRDIKKRCNLISNGFNLEEALESKDKNEKIVIKRVIEELFIKEQLQNRDISKFHSRYSIFEGISCIHLKNERIRKITVLKDGKIKSESCEIFEDCNLKSEFDSLIKKFDIKIDYNKIKWMEIKFMKIGKQYIYIVETGLRLYFDSDDFIKNYEESLKNNKSISRGLNGFFGMSMAIRLNKKEQMYYSFYDTGIDGEEKFSPNIKKLITDRKLNENEYEIFCESLVFKYLSNSQRLASYPFFFKLTSEI